MTDFPCTRALINGVIIGVSLSIFSFFVYTLKPDSQPITSKSNFEVVDTYKGCNVVRWDNGFAEYKYFLDCKKGGQAL
jgi:hypothetical protein